MEFKIPQAKRHIKKAYLQIGITATSNSLVAAPLYMWFKELNWLSNGSATLIQRLYGETLHILHALLMNPDQRRYFAKDLNIDPLSDFSAPMSIASSATRNFWVPIPILGTDDDAHFPLERLRSDFVLRIVSKAAKESGSGTITLNTFKLWLQEEDMPDGDHDRHFGETAGWPLERSVFHNLMQTHTSIAMTASTAIQPIQLTSFAGRELAALLVLIRSSTSNTSAGARTFVDLGPAALVNLFHGPEPLLSDVGKKLCFITPVLT